MSNFELLSDHDQLYAQRLLRQYEAQLDLEAQPYSDLLEDLEAGENTDGFSLKEKVLYHEVLLQSILKTMD